MLLTVLGLFGSGFYNTQFTSSKYEDKVDEFARITTTAVDDNGFLIMAGVLENNIRIACRDYHKKVNIINLSYGLSRTYRRYVSSLFSDVRLSNLATIGFGPLLETWLKNNDHALKDTVLLADPNIWARNGYATEPYQTIYKGIQKNSLINTTELKQQTVFWKMHLADYTLPTTNKKRHFAQPWYTLQQRYISKFVNNLGVTLQNYQMDNEAWDMYQISRQIDTNNISALMNLTLLAQTLNKPDYESYHAQLKDTIDNNQNRIPLWQLSILFGYVHHPAAYIEQGFAWAISGKPYAAIRDIRQAIDLSTETIPMKLLLASLYLDTDEVQSGESLYQDILETDPNNIDALIGMARLALTRNNLALARDYLEKLSKLDVDPNSTPIEGLIVAIATRNGNYETAKKILLTKLKENPDNYRVWAILAMLAAENDDAPTLQKADSQLEKGVEHNPILGAVLGQMEINRHNYSKARRYLEMALQAQPSAHQLRTDLVRVLTALREKDEAETQAGILLINDPNHALANYVIGTIQLERGELGHAENSFRTSLARDRDANTLNDLAWLLALRTEYEEAASLSREAVDLNPENGNYQDTYGYILMMNNELREAKQTFDKALHYQPDNPVILYHMAMVQSRLNHPEKSIQIIDSLLTQQNSKLDPQLIKDLHELKRQLD